MFKPIFGFLALAFSLFGTQCWAQSCTVEEPNCHNVHSEHQPYSVHLQLRRWKPAHRSLRYRAKRSLILG